MDQGLTELAKRYLTMTGDWMITSGIQILLIVVLLAFALRGIHVLSEKTIKAICRKKKDDAEIQKRTDTLNLFIRNTLNIAMFTIAALMILREIGIDIGPIMAAAGVVGVAVGFGAQNLVKDLIGGFFILIEDQVRVGDVVEISGLGGLVEKINIRTVVLRDLSGNVHFIRNGNIDIVTNMTKDYSRYVFDIGVAYREDTDEVVEIIRSVDEEMRQEEGFRESILEPIEILGLDKFADSAVIIKARNKTKPIKQWEVAREFNRRLKKRFDECGIEIPFPHTTLYIGQDKKGGSPPLNVAYRRSEESDLNPGRREVLKA
ncbi:MAG: mechanosensitive ion channel family protein [Candidatus Omnitrophica bacterium]|nr:mechanosensitive ion channel family protein [Candidatus Omnitrophota bacterium]